MRKAISFMNSKGGTGKTTVCGTIAHHLSKLNKVLLVDADPQGNVSGWFVRENVKHELSDVLSGKANLKETMVEVRDGLFIVPTVPMSGDLTEFAEVKLYRERFAFADLKDAATNLGFDYLLFDTSPGTNLLERSVMAVCDEIAMPFELEFFSVDGIERFLHEIKRVQQENRVRVIHEKVIANKVNNSFRRHKVYRDIVENYRMDFYGIPQSAAIAEAQTVGQTIFEYRPSDKSITAFQDIAEDLQKTPAPAESVL